MPSNAPTSWAIMNGRTDAGLIPAKVSENTRPIVTAGFANDVDEVNRYADPIQAATATGINLS
jgi:hypothetical protein